MSSHYLKLGQQIVCEYRLAGGAWPARKIEMADWAISHRKWDITPEDKLRVCADFLAEAMREEYITDEAGYRVRVKHPAKTRRDGERGTFWDDIRTAKPEFMAVSVAQRRNGIVAECRQLNNDVRYFNGLHPEISPFQLVLDFTRDVRELDQQRVA